MYLFIYLFICVCVGGEGGSCFPAAFPEESWVGYLKKCHVNEGDTVCIGLCHYVIRLGLCHAWNMPDVLPCHPSIPKKIFFSSAFCSFYYFSGSLVEDAGE